MTEPTPDLDVEQRMCALREDGAHVIDPVAWYYLEALARRAENHQGRVGQILQDKLRLATQTLSERIHTQMTASAESTPAERQPNALRDLVDRLGAHGSSEGAKLGTHRVGGNPELKSVQNFRNTWAKLSIDRQVAHAFAQAPHNAGPLNSHVVALRALTQMRDLSPDYLHRFLSYVDTLARLDPSGAEMGAGKRPSAKAEPGKKKRVAK